MSSRDPKIKGAPRRAMFLMSLGLLLLPVVPGRGEMPRQIPQPQPGPLIPPSRTLPDGSAADPSLGGSNAPRMEHMRQDDRRKRLLADTAKLVALSTELNTEVEKTSKDELSVDVVRKAAEIEKLARDVKERMKS